MTKPTEYDWGNLNVSDSYYFRLSGISSSLKNNGYAIGEIPAQQDHNELFRNNYLWQQFLNKLVESNKSSQMLYSSGSASWNGS